MVASGSIRKHTGSTGRPRIAGPATVLVLLAGLAGCSPDEADAPSPDPSDRTEAPAHAFTEVTAEAGLDAFRHETGAFGKKWFPESMGSGGGFIDYDGDGWLDILLAGGGTWPESDLDPAPALWLYRNNGDGTFTQKTADAGLAGVRTYSNGLTVADYDNDGDPDVYLTTLTENLLFRNDGGVFVEVAREAHVAGEPTWSTAALFFDADRDGRLDLYVGNYVAWSPDSDLFCSLDGENKDYCTPQIYEGVPGRYYRNNGDGTFSDRTEEAGFLPAPGKTLGVAELDVNRDGWPDLAVANDTEPDQLYVNNGDGTFTDQGVVSGIAYDDKGRTRAGMGIDAGVIDSTGAVSVVVGNFSREMIGVYRDSGNGLFTDRAAASRIGRPSLMTLTFGLFLFDVDLDGDLDLFAANGHVNPDIERVAENIRYAEPPHLFINHGDGTFEDAVPEAGGALRQDLVARGAAYGDYDRDGDLDVLLTENAGPVRLWRNELRGTGRDDEPHFLRVHVEGRTSNRDGLGTRLVAVTGALRMERRIRSGSSYLSASEQAATFGLGAHPQVDSLVVYWPAGTVERYANLQRNQDILLVEGTGTLTPLPAIEDTLLAAQPEK